MLARYLVVRLLFYVEDLAQTSLTSYLSRHLSFSRLGHSRRYNSLSSHFRLTSSIEYIANHHYKDTVAASTVSGSFAIFFFFCNLNESPLITLLKFQIIPAHLWREFERSLYRSQLQQQRRPSIVEELYTGADGDRIAEWMTPQPDGTS